MAYGQNAGGYGGAIRRTKPRDDAALNALTSGVVSGNMDPRALQDYVKERSQDEGPGGAIRRQTPDMQEVRRQRLQQEVQFGQSKLRYAQTHPDTRQGGSFQATPGGPTIEFSSQQAGDAGKLAGGIRGAYEAYKGQGAIKAMKAAQLAEQVKVQQAQQAPPAQAAAPVQPQIDPATGNAKGYDPALDNFRNSGGTTKMAYGETPAQYAGRAAREANPSLYQTQAEQYFRDNPPQTPQPAQDSPAQAPQAQQAPASTDDFTNVGKMAENKLKQLQAAVPGSPEARSLSVQLDMLRKTQGKFAELQPQAPAAQPAPAAGTQAPATTDPATGWPLRHDGTKKGTGFLGIQKTTNGGVATELTVGVSFDGQPEMEIPTYVPTLTKEELDWLNAGGNPLDKSPIGKSIYRKAISHAQERIRAGKSQFIETDKGELPAVKADADFDRLPSGTEFIGPDGKKWRKK